MPVYTVDLHNHTPLIPSDYRGPADTSPRRIVEAVHAAGIDVWGVTDHSSVGWTDHMIQAANDMERETGRRVLIVPGFELKVRHLGSEAHVVALFEPGTERAAFASVLEFLGLSDPVCERLQDLPRFAVEHDPVEVCEHVLALGGTAHIGHIDRAFGARRLADEHLMFHMLARGIRVCEVVDRDSRGYLFAEGEPRTVIMSSDSHSIPEIGRRTTQLQMTDLSFTALRAALLGRPAIV